MTDPAILAREARRALAQAHTATLLVEGLGRVSPDPAYVLLDDRNGHPRFSCSVGSPIAMAAVARCPAILDIGRPTQGSLCAGSVIFAGHLAVGTSGAPAFPAAADLGVAADLGAAADLVALVVELHLVCVIVEIDDPNSHSVLALRVPLEVYCSGSGAPAPTHAAPDLAQAAETMRVHTNARHAEKLRACAAARAGVPDGAIIEAQLLDVAAEGATLEWLDGEGGHVVRMGFPRAAQDGQQLATALRHQLCSLRDCGE